MVVWCWFAFRFFFSFFIFESKTNLLVSFAASTCFLGKFRFVVDIRTKHR